jgi:hypothetical protein
MPEASPIRDDGPVMGDPGFDALIAREEDLLFRHMETRLVPLLVRRCLLLNARGVAPGDVWPVAGAELVPGLDDLVAALLRAGRPETAAHGQVPAIPPGDEGTGPLGIPPGRRPEDMR